MNNRDIDKLISKKVMGWTEIRESGFTGFDFVGLDPNHKPTDWYLIPHYSTDISAAWQVVNHLLETHEGLVFHTMSPTPDRVNWYAGFGVQPPTDEVYFANAGTPSMAICLAALKCVGVEIKADSDPRP